MQVSRVLSLKVENLLELPINAPLGTLGFACNKHKSPCYLTQSQPEQAVALPPKHPPHSHFLLFFGGRRPILLCRLPPKHLLQRQRIQPNLDFGNLATLVEAHVPRIRLVVAHTAVGVGVDGVQVSGDPPVLSDNDALFPRGDLELDARWLNQVADLGPCGRAVGGFAGPDTGEEGFARHSVDDIIADVGEELVTARRRLREQGEDGADLGACRVRHGAVGLAVEAAVERLQLRQGGGEAAGGREEEEDAQH